MNRKQFTFYASFFEAVSMLSRAADRCRVYEAICRFGLYGEEPDPNKLTGGAALAWQLIRPVLDAGRRRAEGGKRGGEISGKDTARIEQGYGKDMTRIGQGSGKVVASKGEKEKEKEVEKEEEIEKEKEDKCPVPGGWEVLEAYRDKINPQPSPRCREELEGFVGTVGPQVCLRAIDEAVDEGKTGWAYIRGILRAKQEQGVRSLADWDALEAKRTAQHTSPKPAGRHQVGCVPGQISRGPDRQAQEDMERMKKYLEQIKREE